MAKRRRGTGSIFKQPGCKTWTIKFSNHGRTVVEATGERDYSAAMKTLTQRLSQVQTNTVIPPDVRRIGIAELASDFLRDYRINGKDLDHAERRWSKHLQPFFGAMRVIDVASSTIDQYVDERLKAGASNASVNRELAALKRMFRLGYHAMPAKVLRLPCFRRLQENNVRKGFTGDDQYNRLVAAASELWLRALLEVSHVYGWRRGELLNLRARQVDLVSRTIRLDPGTTKNRKGREVPMTDTVYALLTECVRGKSGDAFVFTRPNGQPVRSFRTDWQNVCIAAGVGSLNCRKCDAPVAGDTCEACGATGRDLKYSGLILHDMRRTAARNLRRAGVGEGVIMQIGGWKTPSVFKRYDIVDQSDVVDALEKLNQDRDERERKSKKAAQASLEFSHDSVMISDFERSTALAAETEKVN